MESELTKNCRKLLRDYEGKLVSALGGVNLEELSRKLMHPGLSPWDWDNFNSISSLDLVRLKPKLVIRYLIQKVSMANEWERFLDILTSYESVGRIAMHFKRDLELLSNSQRRFISYYGSKDSEPLIEHDIGKLVDILGDFAFMWENIGIGLGLPRGAIEECRSGSSNTIKLQRILHAWLVGEYRGAKPCTLNDLKDVLAGPIVGHRVVAKKLSELFFIGSISNNTMSESFSVVNECSYTEVKYSKSLLLGIQVSPYQESVQYQWLKDGKLLQDGPIYQGVFNDILYIKQATEGEYICSVQVDKDSGKIKTVNKSTVQLFYPPPSGTLVNLYSQLKEIPSDYWPPVCTAAFINLTILNRKGRSVTFNTSDGIDDLRHDENLINYEHIFERCSGGSLWFVEGRPGSGKTTLVHKITSEWATNHKVLKGASKVYLISLRMLNSSAHDESLFDLIRPFYADKDSTRKALTEVVLSDGEDVCFILDGFDEYIGNNKDNIVQQLIYKKILPLSMVIVASRPIGTAVHRDKAPVTNIIEVLGFTNESIFNYIKEYPFSKDKLKLKLKEYLLVQPNIFHMCYLPVHISMICFLYAEMEDAIPCTETKIYEYFTSLTIVRGFKRGDDEQSSFTSLDDLEGEVKENFLKVCQLAFDMTKKSVQMVSQRNTKIKLHHSKGSDTPTLGLIVIDSTAKLFGYEDVYTFLHLTFQEYLAAYYLARLDSPRQDLELELFGKLKQYQVLKFYCGQFEFHTRLDQVVTILKTFPSGSIYSMHCVYESQSSVVCEMITDSVFGWMSKKDSSYCEPIKYFNCLTLSHLVLTPSDFQALGFFISNLSFPFQLQIDHCHFDEDGVGTFLSKIQPNKKLIRSIAVHYDRNLPYQPFNLLLTGLSHIEELDLKIPLTGSKITSLTDRVTLSNLKVLHIILWYVERQFINLLQFNSKVLQTVYAGYCSSDYFSNNYSHSLLFPILKKLVVPHREAPPEKLAICGLDFTHIDVRNFHQFCFYYSLICCNIGDDEVAVLVDVIGEVGVNSLRLDVNNITNKGAMLLAGFIKNHPSLKTFTLSFNFIDDDGAIAIAESFDQYQHRNLNFLDLQGNAIGDKGMKVLKTKTFWIKELYIWNVKASQKKHKSDKNFREDVQTIEYKKWIYMYPDGTYKQANRRIEGTIDFHPLSSFLSRFPETWKTILKYCHNLNHLSVRDIGGVEVIISALRSCKKLTELSLVDCGIGTAEIVALCGELKHCPYLEKLDLSGADIKFVGSEALISALKDYNNIKLLILSYTDAYRIYCKDAEAVKDYFLNAQGIKFHMLD